MLSPWSSLRSLTFTQAEMLHFPLDAKEEGKKSGCIITFEGRVSFNTVLLFVHRRTILNFELRTTIKRIYIVLWCLLAFFICSSSGKKKVELTRKKEISLKEGIVLYC